MKKTFLLFLLSSFSVACFSARHTISTTAENGNVRYTNDTLNIVKGDTIIFNASPYHPTREVSEATWLANGTESNNGFPTKTGANDTIFTKDWTGSHYYVCIFHVGMGMKGVINVSLPTSVFSYATKNELFKVFPSPFLNKFSLEISEIDQVSVSNISGVIQFDFVLENGLSIVEIDATKLESGIYYVSLFRNGTMVECKKVIKN